MKTLQMIGNAHIDPVWLWHWQEGFQEIKATFQSALDRLNEYEDFIFIASSAAFYEWVEQNDPAMFAKIQKRVAEGRWELVGGWWVEPDCNVPAGESFVRQALYGQRFFKSRFGKIAKVGFNPDSFGHHAMMPQLLAKSGLDSYLFLRPNMREKTLPGRLFWWESQDGSKVLTFRIPFEYCAPGDDIEAHVKRCADELDEKFEESMCFYGVGNHGGGPTKKNLDWIRAQSGKEGFPSMRFGSPGAYFARARERGSAIPTLREELQHHARGCYAAHSEIKRLNRRAEWELLVAERWSAVAGQLAAQPWPGDLERAWKNVLFNQFHDILAGTSLESAYEHARDAFGEAKSVAGRATNAAVQALSWKIAIAHEEATRPLVVFNPHAWDARFDVELEIGGLKASGALLDEAGREQPVQVVRSEATAGAWRKRICFSAEVPALGYRTWRLRLQEEGRAQPSGTLSASDATLENDRLRLELDPSTGCPKSLFDKRRNVELLAAPARAAVMDDATDTWGHTLRQFTDEVGTFRVIRMRCVEQGPVRAAIEVQSAFGASSLLHLYTLSRDADAVEVRSTLDWREPRKALKLRVPTTLTAATATSEIPFGSVVRAAEGDEEPGGAWLDLSGTAAGARCGLSLLNDSKHSYDVDGGALGLTVARSPIFAHHDPTLPVEGDSYSYLDFGIQRFRWALLPHGGDWRDAGTARRAAELNQPPFALAESFHPGPLPQRASHVAIDRPNVLLTTLKRAEDGDGLVLRCHEAHGQPTDATIELKAWGRTLHARFGACEIKTWRLPADSSKPAVEVNLLEE